MRTDGLTSGSVVDGLCVDLLHISFLAKLLASAMGRDIHCSRSDECGRAVRPRRPKPRAGSLRSRVLLDLVTQPIHLVASLPREVQVLACVVIWLAAHLVIVSIAETIIVKDQKNDA